MIILLCKGNKRYPIAIKDDIGYFSKDNQWMTANEIKWEFYWD